MSWVRAEIDNHEQDVVELRAQGVVLPRGMSITDLRVVADRCLAPGSRHRWPGSKTLGDRWGWGEKRARLLVEDPGAWCDPLKREAWDAYYAEISKAARAAHAARASKGRAEGRAKGEQRAGAKTEEPSQSTQQGEQRASKGRAEGRAKGDTRGEDHDHGRNDHGVSPGARAIDRSVDVAEALALQERDEPHHGMNQPRDRQAVERALARGLALSALLVLWAWSGSSSDTDAEACRKGGWRRWSSLLKAPLGDERLAAAVRWDQAGRPTTTRATGPPARAGPPGSFLDALETIARNNADADGYAVPARP